MENRIINKDIRNGVLEVEGSEDFVQSEINELFAVHAKEGKDVNV